ncbi:MAG: alpha/beta hydrolase [Bdellovibrionota bacterium]
MRKFDITLLRALHWVGQPVLRAGGFEWEHRRTGDLKIGYWKKTFSKSGRKSRSTRRKRRFVLIPGLGDTPLSWWPVIQLLTPALKREFDEIVLVDLPGFQGFLRDEKAFHTMDLMLVATHDLLDQLAPHTVFGHSLGGWLAASYAGECGKGTRPRAASGKYAGPERTIIASPSGVVESDEKLKHWKGHFDRARAIGFDAYRKLLFRQEPRWFRYIVGDFQKFFRKQEVLDFIESVRSDHFVTPLLPDVKSDFWLLWGEQDELVPAAWAEDWLAELRKGRRTDGDGADEADGAEPSLRLAAAITLKNVGHSPHLESPFVTALVLARILGSKLKRGEARRRSGLLGELQERLWEISWE